MNFLKFIKYIFLFFLTFLLGVQTTYAKAEFVLPQNQVVFSIEQSQSFKSLEKEVPPNIGFLKEKVRFVVSEGVSALNHYNFSTEDLCYLANAGGKLGTLIDDAVLIVTKNESLPNWIKQSFKNGEYVTVQTKQKITLYRDFGDKAFMDGSFSTTVNNATRNELALHQSFENSMRFKSTIEVPSGEILDIGKVGPYPPGTPNALPGGADQILLPENYSHNWIREILDTQTGQTYTVDAFKSAFPSLIKNP